MQFFKLKGDATSYTGEQTFSFLLDIHLPGNAYYLQEMIRQQKEKKRTCLIKLPYQITQMSKIFQLKVI